MADKISMSQRALPKVTSLRYISGQRYIPNNVTLKKRQESSAFYDRCRPSAGPRWKTWRYSTDISFSFKLFCNRHFNLLNRACNNYACKLLTGCDWLNILEVKIFIFKWSYPRNLTNCDVRWLNVSLNKMRIGNLSSCSIVQFSQLPCHFALVKEKLITQETQLWLTNNILTALKASLTLIIRSSSAMVVSTYGGNESWTTWRSKFCLISWPFSM